MKAIIPAAGVGSRMRPHTYTTAKILIKVGEKTIIDYIFEKLITNGIDDIIMILSPDGDRVKSYIKNRYSVKTKFFFQSELKGIAHAVSMASDELTDEPVIIILGDTIFEGDLKKLLESEYSSLGVKEIENPEKFGVAVVDDNGFVKRVEEKPDTFVSNLALVGIYFFKNGAKLKNSIKYLIKNNITTKGEYQITDAIQNMIENGEKITEFKIEDWYDCGNPANILSTNRYILTKYPKKSFKTNSAVIDPCYISPNAEIINSVIGPYVTIGDGTKIINSIIKDSIVGENSHIEYLILKDSIIGNNAFIKSKESSLNIGDTTKITF